MQCHGSLALTLTAVAIGNAALHGAYLIEIDTDGIDDGIVTLNSDFSYGGDTTAAFQSAASGAHGLSGGDSIYGGNGVSMPDTYTFIYTPDSQADNLFISPATPLGDGNFATGASGGPPGRYAVYATWPTTNNVTGGLTNYHLQTAGDTISTSINQNNSGNVWVKVGEIEYSSGPIVVTQSATANTAVSMRAAGILIELLADTPPDSYNGPPGPVVIGTGNNEFLGLAFLRNKAEAASTHHAVVRSSDLRNWATTDLKLFSSVAFDADHDLVTFRSMTPMIGQTSEFLALRSTPKRPAAAPYVAMTFDDGPHPTRTPALLDLLAGLNIRATFYVTGINAQWHPQIIRRMINEGHEVGNHSWNHPNLTTLSEEEALTQLRDCRNAVIAAATAPPATMRPPYGAVNNSLRDLFLAEFGYRTVLWDVDPRDWDAAVSDQEVIDTILNNAQHESIILAHDIHQRTIDLMPTVLEGLLAEGYSFVTVSELFELQEN